MPEQNLPGRGNWDSDILVRDYMTSSVNSLNEDACLLDAALMIRHSGKRHVPVVTAEKKVVGIISDRDVSRLAPTMLARMTQEEYHRVLEGTPIKQVMTKNPITIAPGAPIAEAVAVLHAKKIGALLVVENEKLVGILTTSDMLGLLHKLVAHHSPDPAAR
jgi:CBS domain-containing protein